MRLSILAAVTKTFLVVVGGALGVCGFMLGSALTLKHISNQTQMELRTAQESTDIRTVAAMKKCLITTESQTSTRIQQDSVYRQCWNRAELSAKQHKE